MLNTITEQWDQWAASSRGARSLTRWQQEYAPLRLWDFEALRTPASCRATDEMQASLVGLAQSGDDNAASTLIVQLRPGLIALTNRTLRLNQYCETFGDTSNEVVGVFSEVLLRHRLDRRPARIAANLLLDTRQRIWRSHQRNARLDLSTTPTAQVVLESAPSADSYHPDAAVNTLDVMDDLAAALGGLGGSVESRRLTAHLAYRAWIMDEAPDQIAADLRIAPGTVNTRLCRLRSRLRHTMTPRHSDLTCHADSGSGYLAQSAGHLEPGAVIPAC